MIKFLKVDKTDTAFVFHGLRMPLKFRAIILLKSEMETEELVFGIPGQVSNVG